ncbi:MAG: aminopeptidase P family protein [Rhodobacteraceae bacterium]|nr:aminopeptidase P family protein [Paracoccaceae bacterium]
MLQTFTTTSRPADGPPRLAALREVLKTKGLDGFLVPRADAHQGEWVAARDERLAWLTGFTGSAGFCAALLDRAGVFIDGRYTIQVKEQIDPAHFTPVPWPATDLADWLKAALPNGGRVGFDPWLHVAEQIAKLGEGLAGSGIELVETDNLVDRIWPDQPPPPKGRIAPHSIEFAGRTSADKRSAMAKALGDMGCRAAVLTLPDSIAWLLNIRGSDIARTPVALAFAILHDSGRVDLFTDPAKVDAEARDHLGADIAVADWEDFGPALDGLQGPVLVDRASAPLWVSNRLNAAAVDIHHAADPCILAKARKNPVEIAGTRAAHLRDAVAMAELLAWLDAQTPGSGLTEIDVVTRLEELRRASNLLVDISFDTICGTGANGAITHYRVTEASNRTIAANDLLLVDSGGQYRDGTTDITRTIVMGQPSGEQRACFTRVLKGMIAISMARWPVGLAGRDLDPLARIALWQAGQDYDHGTGHGVGVFLGVHEGPQRISRLSHVPLEPGMILSNEPGYYREGAFGIRIENLIVVEPAPALEGGDARDMLQFETITYAPIDRNLIEASLLSQPERDWLNAYHREVLARVAPDCTPETQSWLQRACAPI